MHVCERERETVCVCVCCMHVTRMSLVGVFMYKSNAACIMYVCKCATVCKCTYKGQVRMHVCTYVCMYTGSCSGKRKLYIQRHKTICMRAHEHVCIYSPANIPCREVSPGPISGGIVPCNVLLERSRCCKRNVCMCVYVCMYACHAMCC
jgi:hypothetical protein